jgi:ribosomal protein L7/L12
MATKTKRAKKTKKAVRTPAAKRMMLELPSKVEFTLAMPGLEKMLLELATRAMEFEDRKHGGAGDPHEERRLQLQAVGMTIEQDRQKLAWEEFNLRKAEFEAREREHQQRREEMRAEKEEREREARERAIARGEAYDVWLMEVGVTKIAVIKVIREFTGLDLKSAKELSESCPCVVKKTLLVDAAARLQNALVNAGAKAEARKLSPTTDIFA